MLQSPSQPFIPHPQLSSQLGVVGVDPAPALSDISQALASTLDGYSGQFKAMVSAIGSPFDSASELLTGIADSEKIKLSLDAFIDFSVGVDLSLGAFEITSSLDKFKTSLTAVIADVFSIPLGSSPTLSLGISPSLTLSLEANNIAVPFDVFRDNPLEKLSKFTYDGQIESFISVGVEGVPAEVTLRASSNNLISLDNIEFDVGLDIGE